MDVDSVLHAPQAPLLTALRALRDAVGAQRLLVCDPDLQQRRARRDRLAAEIDGHVARLRDMDAPLLAVIAGGTGAGKSTVVNTLVGRAVAATGVIRPTTSSPTLVVAPQDERWFAGSRVLPGLARVRHDADTDLGSGDGRALHVVVTHAVPPGLAVVDAPDIDSVNTGNRDLAQLLLDAADVWVWLATARTYADEAGMGYLRRAARRRTALAVVLTQVHDRDVQELTADLRDKLAAEDLGDVEVLVVRYVRVEAQRLPAWAVEDVRRWLFGLADPRAARRLRRQTLEGALADLPRQVGDLMTVVQDEAAVTARLVAEAEAAFRRVPAELSAAMDDGLPLRGEVLARWSEFVGTARFATMVETATSMVRGWLRDAMSTVTSAEEQRLQRQVRGEVAGTVTDLVADALQLAVGQVTADWRRSHAGAGLLASRPDLAAPDPGLRQRTTAAVAAWQEHVVELVRTRGAERKVRARWVSTLVNAGATAAILGAFASTGGLTGVEAGLAAGASAANQALLVRLLGAHNLQWLLQRVRADLLDRVEALTRSEQVRYSDAVASVAPSPDDVAALQEALAEVERVRGGQAR